MGKKKDEKNEKREVSWTCFCGKTIWAFPEDLDTAIYVHQLQHA